MTAVTMSPTELDPRQVGIQIEAKLADWSILYEYVPDFAVADIRVVEWTQVRDEAHLGDKDTLAEFRTQMAHGAVYPPVILMHPDVLIDGNHRLRAAQGLKRRSLPAFVCQFNSVDLAKTFSAAVANLSGRRLNNDEAQRAALTMIARGMADESIAREIGRSVEMVRQTRKLKDFEERAAAMPEIADAAARLPRPQRVKLAGIAHNPVLAEAVKLVAETRPKASDLNTLVKATSTARSDGEAIQAVRELRAELAPAGPPPHRVTVPPQVRQAALGLGQLLKHADNVSVVLDLTTPERRTASIQQWTRLQSMTESVLGLYGPA